MILQVVFNDRLLIGEVIVVGEHNVHVFGKHPLGVDPFARAKQYRVPLLCHHCEPCSVVLRPTWCLGLIEGPTIIDKDVLGLHSIFDAMATALI